MINLLIANIWITIISILWLISALLLIFIILIQKGKGGGLGGAFGGAGGGGGLLGTKTGDFLTWVTIGLVFFFFFLAILLVKYGKLSVPDDLRRKPGATTNMPLDEEGKTEKTQETDTTKENSTPDEGGDEKTQTE